MNKGSTIIISSLVAVSLLAGCGGKKGGGPDMGMGQQNSVSISVNTQTAAPLTIEQSVTISSKISADNEVAVYPSSNGTVKNVYVSLGDSVNAGDILFETDSSDAKLQLEQAQASLSSAQAGLSSAQAGLDSAKANYESNVGGTLENQLQQLQSSVDNLQIQYNDALTSLEQTKELYEMGGTSKQSLDDQQSNVDKLKVQLDTAKKQLDLNKNKIAEETKKSSQANVNQSQANVKQSQASVAQSQVSVESAQKAVDDTKVKAEISGVVTELNITQGSNATAQTAALTISDISKVKVSFSVSEDVINRIAVGSKAYVTVSAVSDTPFETTISSLSPAADSQTKLYTVEAYIDNANGQLKPGMFATVKLVVDTKENTISVPLNTVIEKDSEKYVFTVDSNNTAHKTDVKTGLKNDESIEITSGVNMGDVVVINGQDFLSDGSSVNVVEKDGQKVEQTEENPTDPSADSSSSAEAMPPEGNKKP